ncbi:MAG: hypothetical protein JXR63_12665 [Spirochaetales bacterium]|nr:hypothetical protein [Spirochaetales bacterium]
MRKSFLFFLVLLSFFSCAKGAGKVFIPFSNLLPNSNSRGFEYSYIDSLFSTKISLQAGDEVLESQILKVVRSETGLSLKLEGKEEDSSEVSQGVVFELPAGQDITVLVEFFDNENNLLYSGSSSVKVVANQTTEVVIKLEKNRSGLKILLNKLPFLFPEHIDGISSYIDENLEYKCEISYENEFEAEPFKYEGDITPDSVIFQDIDGKGLYNIDIVISKKSPEEEPLPPEEAWVFRFSDSITLRPGETRVFEPDFAINSNSVFLDIGTAKSYLNPSLQFLIAEGLEDSPELRTQILTEKLATVKEFRISVYGVWEFFDVEGEEPIPLPRLLRSVSVPIDTNLETLDLAVERDIIFENQTYYMFATFTLCDVNGNPVFGTENYINIPDYDPEQSSLPPQEPIYFYPHVEFFDGPDFPVLDPGQQVPPPMFYVPPQSAPQFNGVRELVIDSEGGRILRWDPATDSSLDSSEITYVIFSANLGEIFDGPGGDIGEGPIGPIGPVWPVETNLVLPEGNFIPHAVVQGGTEWLISGRSSEFAEYGEFNPDSLHMFCVKAFNGLILNSPVLGKFDDNVVTVFNTSNYDVFTENLITISDARAVKIINDKILVAGISETSSVCQYSISDGLFDEALGTVYVSQESIPASKIYNYDNRIFLTSWSPDKNLVLHELVDGSSSQLIMNDTSVNNIFVSATHAYYTAGLEVDQTMVYSLVSSDLNGNVKDSVALADIKDIGYNDGNVSNCMGELGGKLYFAGVSTVNEDEIIFHEYGVDGTLSESPAKFSIQIDIEQGSFSLAKIMDLQIVGNDLYLLTQWIFDQQTHIDTCYAVVKVDSVTKSSSARMIELQGDGSVELYGAQFTAMKATSNGIYLAANALGDPISLVAKMDNNLNFDSNFGVNYGYVYFSEMRNIFSMDVAGNYLYFAISTPDGLSMLMKIDTMTGVGVIPSSSGPLNPN